jgi:hypothetical protein
VGQPEPIVDIPKQQGLECRAVRPCSPPSSPPPPSLPIEEVPPLEPSMLEMQQLDEEKSSTGTSTPGAETSRPTECVVTASSPSSPAAEQTVVMADNSDRAGPGGTQQRQEDDQYLVPISSCSAPSQAAEPVMHEWSAVQVSQWVCSLTFESEAESDALQAAFAQDGGLDGEELIDLKQKQLLKLLRRSGTACDAESRSLVDRVFRYRDALTAGSEQPELTAGSGTGAGSSASPRNDDEGTAERTGQSISVAECPLCFEQYHDGIDGGLMPRIVTRCGHTFCHGCVASMLTRIIAVGNAKPFPCPTCRVVTNVRRGRADSLAKNFSLLELLGPECS